MYGVSMEEQETHINFERLSDRAIIYTSDRTTMTKLDKCVKAGTYKLEEVHKTSDGDLLAKEYSCPKKFISFRSKEVTRDLTDEQKQAMADATSERFKKYWEHKKSQNQNGNVSNK